MHYNEKYGMQRDKNFFLVIIFNHLNYCSTTVPACIEMEKIEAIAKAHQVEGIIYYQTKSPLFLRAYSSTLYYHTNRLKVLSTLTDRLKEEGIEYFIIKGFSVAAYYPVPALRTMGDTDIVVHSKERNRVDEIMLELGFVNDSHFDDREWVYYKGEMEFELHDHLVYTEDVNQEKHIAFFNNFWQYVHDGELDKNFHFLFLLLHLRKHLMNSGVGFRQFMDIAVMARQNLDWVWIEEKLTELELLEFCQTVMALNNRWFAIPAPIPSLVKEIDVDFYEAATEAVFKNGVFGFDNKENRDNVAINANLAGKSSMNAALRKLFPSYQTLCNIPHYAFVKGRAWMLPFVWVYRMVRPVFRREARSRFVFLTRSFVAKEKIDKRSEELKQWGLR